jgi:hypothetical protein
MSSDHKPRIFISYSHQDVEWLKRLQVHLRPLVRDADVDLWDDTRLKAGDKWRQEIKDAITTPKVAIFLISANFYASDFIATEELPALLHADISFGTELIPVLISASRSSATRSCRSFKQSIPRRWPSSSGPCKRKSWTKLPSGSSSS